MAQGDALTAGDSADSVLSQMRAGTYAPAQAGQKSLPESVQAVKQTAAVPQAVTQVAQSNVPPPFTYSAGTASTPQATATISGVIPTDAEERARALNAPREQRIAELRDEIRQKQSEVVAPPKSDYVPPPPPYEVREPVKAFGSFASALAVFAGFLTRRPLVTALNASADAIEAARQGDMGRYQQAIKTWQQNKDEALRQTDYAQKLYHDVLQDKQKTVDEKLAEIRALAANEKNDYLLETLRLHDYDAVQKHIDTVDGLTTRTRIASMVADQRQQQIAATVRRLNDDPRMDAYRQFLQENPNASAADRAKAATKTGASELFFENHVYEVKDAVNDVYNALDEAEAAGKFSTGIGGRIQTIQEWINSTEARDDISATKVRIALSRLQNAYQDLRGDHRSGGAAEARLNDAVEGLGRFTNVQQARASIDMMSNEVSRIMERNNLVDPLTKKATDQEIYAIKQTPPQFQDALVEAIQAYNMPPEAVSYFLAIPRQESNWNPSLEGSSGDRGLFQITKPTAKDIGVDYDRLFDARTNIDAAAKHFMALWREFKGDGSKIFDAWNRGPNNAGAGQVRPETNEKYVAPSLAERARLIGLDSKKPPNPAYPKLLYAGVSSKDDNHKKFYWYKEDLSDRIDAEGGSDYTVIGTKQ